MKIKTTRSANGKVGMMALLMAIIALWATMAIAGVNEELYKAAERGDLPEVKRLLAKGADVNARGFRPHRTALIQASRNGHVKVVQELLAKGADVNAKDKLFGEFPLLVASIEGHLEVVQVLLANGADVNNVLMRVSTSEKGDRRIVEALLSKGAEVNARDLIGETALMGACYYGPTVTKVVRFKGSTKTSMMKIPDETGNPEIVQLLLANGADVNAKDNYGKTALMRASQNGRTAIVQLLLANGADVNAEDNYGRTALKWASNSGHRKTQEILIKAGAK